MAVAIVFTLALWFLKSQLIIELEPYFEAALRIHYRRMKRRNNGAAPSFWRILEY